MMTTTSFSPMHRLQQRGAASLIVVMILFFVVSMVAAYTNRNLIFEQKTSVNQSRSTRALEAADAGVEWALTMLNSGRLTAACQPSANVADTTFRERYLNIDPDTGNILPRKRADGVTGLYPTCVYNGAAWTCDCPTNADAAVAAPAGNDIYPAFRLRFRRVCVDVTTNLDADCGPPVPPGQPVQPGVVHIDIHACTTLNEDCLRFFPPQEPTGVPNEGRAAVHVVAALRSALPSKPEAGLTARGTVSTAAAFTVTNSEVTGSSLTVRAGGPYVLPLVPPMANLVGKAGTPPASTIFAGDPSLNAAAMTPERFFAATFGMWRTTFRDQPGTMVVNCAVSCSAATLRTKIALNPGRMLWVVGDLDFDSPGDIGSAAAPVLINVTGNVTFSVNVTVYGVIYSQAAAWAASGSGTVFGAALAEGDVNGNGASTTSIVYNKDVLTRLRTITGSFVRVPGTWRDFDT